MIDEQLEALGDKLSHVVNGRKLGLVVVHGDDPWKERELPLFFLLSYIGIFLAGPGKYSADTVLRK